MHPGVEAMIVNGDRIAMREMGQRKKEEKEEDVGTYHNWTDTCSTSAANAVLRPHPFY